MNKGGMGDNYYIIIVDENINWMKLAHLSSNFSPNLTTPFCTSIFTSRFFKPFLNVHTRENRSLSLMYTMYANTSNNTPFYTHVSLYMI